MVLVKAILDLARALMDGRAGIVPFSVLAGFLMDLYAQVMVVAPPQTAHASVTIDGLEVIAA